MFQDPKDDIFRKLSSKFIEDRGPTHSFYRLISKVEARKGVLIGTKHLCKQWVMDATENSGRCSRVMMSTKRLDFVISAIFVSRKVPLEVREKIRLA